MKKVRTIQQSLLYFALTVTGLALLVVGSFAAVAHFIEVHRKLVEDLDVLMELTVEYGQPYLAFDDPAGAQALLKGLLRRHDVLGARLMRSNDSVLSEVHAAGHAWPAAKEYLELHPAPWLLSDQDILLKHGLQQDGEQIGTLELHIDLRPVWGELARHLGMFGVAMLFGFFLAYVIARRMRHLITDPIVELGTAAEQIAASRQYDLRVNKTSDDEIGTLIDRFNAMLVEIEHADGELRHQRDTLEQQVEERTHELRSALEAAQAASRAKSQFLANMSHEIRTPMNGVIGLAQLLNQAELPARERKYVSTLLHAGESLMSLLNDVLDFARGEAGKLTLEKIVFDLPQLAHEVHDLFLQRAHNKGLSFKLELDDKLPQFVVGDALRLRQLLANLVSNAIKFTSTGEVVLRIALEGSSTDGRTKLVFVVSDTGIGIPPELQGRLFAAFSQVDDSMSRRHGGSGLGLAICRQIVDLMDGTIGVDSNYDGSTFIVRAELPIAQAGPVSAGPVSALPFFSKDLCVLVAEDNETNLLVTETMLGHLGVGKVIVAANGHRAISQHRQADIIFMDCQMPEMDGYEATRRIRKLEDAEKRPHVPIVALTAHALDEERQRCIDAGMDDFLTKPVILRSLADMMARHLPAHLQAAGSPDETTPPPVLATSAAATAPATIEPALIDRAVLNDTLASVPAERRAAFLQRLLDSFRRGLDARLAVLRDTPTDAEAIHLAAHALKSAAGQVGARLLAQRALELEMAARAADATAMVPLVAVLPDLAEQSWTQLREIFS